MSEDDLSAFLGPRPEPQPLNPVEELLVWAARIDRGLLGDGEGHDGVNAYANLLYRPHEDAHIALTKLSIRYPMPVDMLRRRVAGCDAKREILAQAKSSQELDIAREGLGEEMGALGRDIRATAAAIAEASQLVTTPRGDGGGVDGSGAESQRSQGSVGTGTGAVKALGVGGGVGEWLSPMSKTDMANRLGNVGLKKVASILRPYGLKEAGNRQLWTVRLDTMPENLRKKLEQVV